MFCELKRQNIWNIQNITQSVKTNYSFKLFLFKLWFGMGKNWIICSIKKK